MSESNNVLENTELLTSGQIVDNYLDDQQQHVFVSLCSVFEALGINATDFLELVQNPTRENKTKMISLLDGLVAMVGDLYANLQTTVADLKEKYAAQIANIQDVDSEN